MSYVYMGQDVAPATATAAPVVPAKPQERKAPGIMRLAFPAGIFLAGAAVGWFAGCKQVLGS